MGRAAAWLTTESEGPEAGSLRPLLALLSKRERLLALGSDARDRELFKPTSISASIAHDWRSPATAAVTSFFREIKKRVLLSNLRGGGALDLELRS